MRLIATILSFYVLLLAFMPCADDLSTDNSQERLSLAQDVDPSLPVGTHNDSCTPFCHCHCCHSHVTFMEMNWHSQTVSLYNQKNTPYTQQKEYLFPFSIFQPPRV